VRAANSKASGHWQEKAMHIVDAAEFEAQEVGAEGVENVRIQWLVDESHGAPTFAMRRFIIGPSGHTPRHAHDWEHEVYVLRGRGTLWIEGDEIALAPDYALLVPPDAMHQFLSAGDDVLEVLCLVPNGPATAQCGRGCGQAPAAGR